MFAEMVNICGANCKVHARSDTYIYLEADDLHFSLLADAGPALAVVIVCALDQKK